MRDRLRQDAALLGISALLLFLEMMMIRWLSSELRIFAYFHNLVLLFAFLGMGLGLLLKGRRSWPLLTVGLLFVFALFISRGKWLGPLDPQAITRYLSIGTGFTVWGIKHVTSVLQRVHDAAIGCTMLVVVLAGLATLFFPLGQLLGRCFDQDDRPLRAYGLNLAGSLLGIGLFDALSAGSTGPELWFALAGVACLPLIRPKTLALPAALLIAASSWLLATSWNPHRQWVVWSPYQKLSVRPTFLYEGHKAYPYGAQVFVNSTIYLSIVNYAKTFMRAHPWFYQPASAIPYDQYNLPYRFEDHPGNVLVVGAGAGNDVAGALRNGATHVTAVEIDPQIIRIGLWLHPEHPFQDPRVTVVNDDARSFFKRTHQKFDTIIFGLLDSHTLSSSYSNVRLDNYVYTLQSFEEAKHLLEPHGEMALYFQVMDRFIGSRLFEMLGQTFGYQPLSLQVPPSRRGYGGSAFITGDMRSILRHVMKDPHLIEMVRTGPAPLWESLHVPITTDDWPYLYLENRGIPLQYWMVFGVLAVLWGLGSRLLPRAGKGLDPRFFLLGAGFMLLETKNVSSFALLFGTTWTVNAIVVAAILVMAMLANLVACKVPAEAEPILYIGLFASLLLNLVVPLGMFSGLDLALKAAAAGALMGLPIFFAGLVFSLLFARTTDRSAALASNLLGAMVGGTLETLSFVIGIQGLLVVATVLYAGSLLTRPAAVPVAGGRPIAT